MNPYQSGDVGQAPVQPVPLMQRIGTWTLWLSLFVLLLPALLVGTAIIWQEFFWDPKTHPGNLELLMWSPILMFVTTPMAVVGGIVGFVMRMLGKRKATTG